MLEVGAVQDAVVAIQVSSLPKDLKAVDNKKREESLRLIEEHVQRLKDQLRARHELKGFFFLHLFDCLFDEFHGIHAGRVVARNRSHARNLDQQDPA